MSEPTNLEAVILSTALELTGAERAAYLDRACEGDARLQGQVQALLEAHEQAGAFLETEPDLKRTVRMTVTPNEKPGDKIGHYKLLQQIGEGGCGVVYMAEQEEPVRRRVALKVIKLGMDTKSVIARFEAERQALALMDHPNIAKVLDAGATETGRPYFVMELVRGIKITDYCDENKISTADRLKLFIQVCQAIQHAHQKGIIHRDIKPSNILVTVNDGVPVPKVIDFGIAKATQGRLTDKTLFTAFEQFIGTPAYMSPEQAVMTSLDIDTRSDIYSLGVLLYELLTGKTPFDANDLFKAGLDAMRRIILEEEPPKPSTRLSTMLDSERVSAAVHRQTDAPKLIHLVRGDLDWIVMKSLEKDRARRYETANGFAADIQRHLDNEPVNACPPSGIYRLQKAVRRNQGVFAAVATITIVLVIGVIVSTSQAIRATRAEREQIYLREQAQKAESLAKVDEQKAKTEAAKSQQTAQFLKDMLKGAGPSVARGRDATVLREILDKAAERVGKNLTNQPEVQGDLWSTLGLTYVDIGDRPRAIPNLQRAVDSYRIALEPNNPKLARTLGLLGSCQSFTGDISMGRTNTQLALAMARKCDELETLAYCLGYATAAFDKFGLTTPQGVAYLREELELWKKLGTNPTALASCMRGLGLTIDNDESEALIRGALKLNRENLSADHPAIANTLFILGQYLLDHDKVEEAEATLHEAFDRFRKVHDKSNPYYSVILRFYVTAIVRKGKWNEAETVVQEAADANWDLLGRLKAYHGEWAAAAELFSRYNNDELLAFALLKTGRDEEYRQLRSRYLEQVTQTHDYGPGELLARPFLLLPVTGIDLERVRQVADSAPTNNDLAWFRAKQLLAKALAEYRAGRFADANATASRAITADTRVMDEAQAWFIQALACTRLQKMELARDALAKGDKIISKPGRDIHKDPLFQWPDWMIADFLGGEAKALIASQAAPTEENTKPTDPAK